ncbi:MAG: IS1634 family transposase [Verrucomicrobiae bacterium]|nr:IS1634 family transposase [Verrucomicrobiae bacterium]
MFLKANRRHKDGKEHIYYTLNETIRINQRRTMQRTVLHLGELTTHQQHRWEHTLDVINEREQTRQMELSSEEEYQRRGCPEDPDVVAIRLSSLEVKNAREFGSCWIGSKMWHLLELDRFWEERLGELRGEVAWSKVVELLAINRLCDPGSELNIHQRWYWRSGMDFYWAVTNRLAARNRLYRCLDRMVGHKKTLEKHLKEKWGKLFHAQFEVLLYDLTSTYFEGLMEEVPQAKRGYSRDHRSDCKQLVIALIVNAQGFPLSYEIFDGNTRDVSSLERMDQVEDKYGKAQRTWVFDRGVVSEENLKLLRQRGGSYVVGTPRSKLKEFESRLLDQSWEKVRKEVDVKLEPGQDGDLYVLARSGERRAKENAMRRKPMRKLFDSLQSLSLLVQKGALRNYDRLVQRLGRLQERHTQVFDFVEIIHRREGEDIRHFEFKLRAQALKKAYRQDGIYIVRTNLHEKNAGHLWEIYIQLTEVEAAFRCFKSEPGLRPIYHWVPPRVEAHVMVAFLGYAMWMALKWKLRSHASSLSPRQIIELFRGIQLVDVWFETADQRKICLPRITMPQPEQQCVLDQLQWNLPAQPPPRIYSTKQGGDEKKCVGDSAP